MSRVRDTAYHELRRQIINGELRPGQALRDADLTVKLGVGRTPLREALMLLAEEGLVTTYHRQGTFVSDVTIRDLQQALEIRAALDVLAARLCIARASDAELDAIEARVLRQDTTHEQQDESSFDEEIHTSIVSLTRNQLLQTMWTHAYTVCRRIKALSLSPAQDPAVIHGQLIDIVRAIRARNVAAASVAVTQHLESFRHSLVANEVLQQ